MVKERMKTQESRSKKKCLDTWMHGKMPKSEYQITIYFKYYKFQIPKKELFVCDFGHWIL
jgi:hypothetical protein